MAQRGRPRHPELLTPREQEVLLHIRDGLTNEEIADRLGVSFNTVKTQVASILSKLGVSTREEAASWHQEERGGRWNWAKGLVALGGATAVAAAVAATAVLAFGVLVAGGGEQDAAVRAETGQTANDDVKPEEDRASRRAQWRLISAPQDDGLQLVIAVGSSTCRSFDRLIVTEERDSVTIEALLNHREVEVEIDGIGPAVVCTLDLRHGFESVVLDEPLGDRQLLGCDWQPWSEARIDEFSDDCRKVFVSAPQPGVASAEQAIEIAGHDIEKHFGSEDAAATTAEYMTADEAAARIGLMEMRLMPDGYTCPGSCPPPGAPRQERGYLVISREVGSPARVDYPEKVLVSWISEDGGESGWNLQLRWVDATGRPHSRMAYN